MVAGLAGMVLASGGAGGSDTDLDRGSRLEVSGGSVTDLDLTGLGSTLGGVLRCDGGDGEGDWRC